MKLEIKILPEDDRKDIDDKDRRVVHIETHTRRNDAFNVQRIDDLIEGNDAMTITMPNGGRLVLNAPKVDEVVYDPDQAAAVRPSQQQNDEGRADPVNLDQVAKDKQAEADAAKRQAEAMKEAKAEANKTVDEKAELARKTEAARDGAPPPTGTAENRPLGTAHPSTSPANNPAAKTPNPSPQSTAASTPPQQGGKK